MLARECCINIRCSPPDTLLLPAKDTGNAVQRTNPRGELTLNVVLATLISLTLLLSGTLATAAPTACPEQYYDQQAPDLLNQKLAAKTKEICYSEYGVLHSGVTRTPLYAGEHLTSEQIQQAKVMVRKSKFFSYI